MRSIQQERSTARDGHGDLSCCTDRLLAARCGRYRREGPFLTADRHREANQDRRHIIGAPAAFRQARCAGQQCWHLGQPDTIFTAPKPGTGSSSSPLAEACYSVRSFTGLNRFEQLFNLSHELMLAAVFAESLKVARKVMRCSIVRQRGTATSA